MEPIDTQDQYTLEQLCADVREAWTEVLGTSAFGDDDDFFAIGGHSLLLARISAMLGAKLHRRLALRLLLDHPTVNTLAAALLDLVQPGAAATPPARDA
jgi:hypothetical protein